MVVDEGLAAHGAERWAEEVNGGGRLRNEG